MQDQNNFESIINSIYQAAVQPELWQSTLGQITDYVGANTGLFVLGTDDNQYQIIQSAAHNVPQDAIDYYNNHIASEDIATAFAIEHLSGKVINTKSVFQYKPELINEAYDGHFCNEIIDFTHRLAFTTNTKIGNILVALQAPKSWGAFGKDSESRLQRLVPHLCRALDIHEKLFVSHIQNNTLLKALENQNHGMILLDKNARLKYLSPLAESLIIKNDQIRYSQKKISLRNHDLNNTLQNLIFDCLKTLPSSGGALSIPSDDAQATHMLITPIRVNEFSFEDWLLPDIGACIFISQKAKSLNHHSAKLLREIYKLTQAESEILVELANGAELRTIAEHRQVSYETVRDQLKLIKQKTNCHKQTELVALVLTSLATLAH